MFFLLTNFVTGLFFRELDRNLIENISEGAFAKCKKLEEIGLKRNPIKNFHYNAFAYLPQLKKL